MAVQGPRRFKEEHKLPESIPQVFKWVSAIVRIPGLGFLDLLSSWGVYPRFAGLMDDLRVGRAE